MKAKQVWFWMVVQEAREFAASLRADGENWQFVREAMNEQFPVAVCEYLIKHRDI